MSVLHLILYAICLFIIKEFLSKSEVWSALLLLFGYLGSLYPAFLQENISELNGIYEQENSTKAKNTNMLFRGPEDKGKGKVNTMSDERGVSGSSQGQSTNTVSSQDQTSDQRLKRPRSASPDTNESGSNRLPSFKWIFSSYIPSNPTSVSNPINDGSNRLPSFKSTFASYIPSNPVSVSNQVTNTPQVSNTSEEIGSKISLTQAQQAAYDQYRLERYSGIRLGDNDPKYNIGTNTTVDFITKPLRSQPYTYKHNDTAVIPMRGELMLHTITDIWISDSDSELVKKDKNNLINTLMNEQDVQLSNGLWVPRYTCNRNGDIIKWTNQFAITDDGRIIDRPKSGIPIYITSRKS